MNSERAVRGGCKGRDRNSVVGANARPFHHVPLPYSQRDSPIAQGPTGCAPSAIDAAVHRDWKSGDVTSPLSWGDRAS
jgi:hypothetical protein